MAESTLMTAADLLASNAGIHRVNVIGDDGRVLGVLSQTDICRAVLLHPKLFDSLLDKSVLPLSLDLLF